MDIKIYEITLADGTKLSGLKLNGNNFISADRITAGMFAGNCAPVVISCDGTAETHESMELVQITEDDGGYWFVLRDVTEVERQLARLDAVICAARLSMTGETVDTDERRLRVSALYPDWVPGSHAAGEHYNAAGQTWECFQGYDNDVYPDIRPGEPAWHTFNRPLHGTSPETARQFVPVQGSHDVYQVGEYMRWRGGLYRCQKDTNYSPEEYPAAWENVSDPDTGREE